MNVLIVHAHENELSYCSSLKDTARAYFENRGDTVIISDLYQMRFNPVASRHDFKQLSEADYYKIQMEQLNAWKKGLYQDEIAEEMRKFAEADLVNFNFPLWWFSLPAILKGWVDRVFAMGFSYGAGKGIYEDGAFPKKKAFLTLTTGGPESLYQANGRNGDLAQILYPINHGILYFVGMQALSPFVVFGPIHLSAEERAAKLLDYQAYLGNLESLTPLYGV